MTAPAMVLAAGLGTRMRAAVPDRPKPLIEVGGRTLIDRVLDHLAAAGMEQAVVNLHYGADRMAEHLARRTRPRIVTTREAVLQETGGGVRDALPLLARDRFIVANSDILWSDGPSGTLGRLLRAWDGARMDALLLVQQTAFAPGYEGMGDYFLDPLGLLRRRGEEEVAPFLFAGVQVLRPGLFQGAPAGPFSLNRLYDRAEAAGRLHAIVHDGEWFHVGTPEGLDLAGRRLAE